MADVADRAREALVAMQQLDSIRGYPWPPADLIAELVAEVESLRAQIAAVRALVGGDRSMAYTFVDERQPPAPKVPSRTARPPKYADFAEALRNNPGEWAEHPYQSDSQNSRGKCVYRINKGLAAAFRDPGYQASERNGVIYVRYNPTTEGA